VRAACLLREHPSDAIRRCDSHYSTSLNILNHRVQTMDVMRQQVSKKVHEPL
jgi:hypothetical protein